MLQENTAALLHHMMVKKQKLLAGALTEFASRHRDTNVQMSETRIYIGLNDAETREQKYDTGRYLDILKDVCKRYHAAFSVDVEEGGYYHEDGEYTEENSLILVLIGTDKEKVQGIAKELCEIFHQESVLVTENRVNGYFLTAGSLRNQSDPGL